MEDYLNLVRLDPQWRCFIEDGSVLNLEQDPTQMAQTLDRFSPGTDSGAHYRKFLKMSARLNDISQRQFFYKSIGGISDMIDFKAAFDAKLLGDVFAVRRASDAVLVIGGIAANEFGRRNGLAVGNRLGVVAAFDCRGAVSATAGERVVASTRRAGFVGDSMVCFGAVVRRKTRRVERAELRRRPKSSMKIWILLILVGLGSFGARAGMLTNAPASIELPDQFEKLQKLSFPNTNLTVLTLADRKGSQQIAGWVEPVAKKFGSRVNVQAIADVSGVPRLLRGTVRSAFRKEQSYPVMMDWAGDVVKRFSPAADHATVLVIDGQGKILRRFVGPATPAEVAELCKLLEQLLAPTTESKLIAKP